MKTILKVIGIIVLLIVGYAIVAILAFGNNYHYEKSMVINAPKEKVWQQINSMKAFNQWNPWMKLDKNMKVTYTGNSGEVGDKYYWDSKNDDAGAGCQEIKELVLNKKQKSEMTFIKPFEGQATSEILLSSEGNSTKVTWTMDTEQETWMKIMRPMMDYQMGKSYEEGLQSLKQICEK
ncbi:SRPBCC family protein [Chryseobacterium wangxinyae]|uniref:SRPBCC family protein n=1 Tax=Chryseobacterium sp. CY350 TaxID=2997336 RepID=UPI002270DBBD|nr:SRPBCC family protein [Chryseobacterium sp. CY350]MCY0979090.1 SRPBCC family protein [Chryseobacterium sp. CY350]WBZ97183.1 SRPBCC family protein [Chryseobacterium sp. CY350]